jgi:hypothetical protein
MALIACVDCKSLISPTAAECRFCGSTDPDGDERGRQNAKVIIWLTFIGLSALLTALAYLGWLMPIFNFLGRLTGK